jgi:hypothetical protein
MGRRGGKNKRVGEERRSKEEERRG